ncbi:hypothetical protein L6452_44748 [Arctium lappa]|nr:hypothetical protein L6452_44748 [Arctium lappa]
MGALTSCVTLALLACATPGILPPAPESLTDGKTEAISAWALKIAHLITVWSDEARSHRETEDAQIPNPKKAAVDSPQPFGTLRKHLCQTHNSPRKPITDPLTTRPIHLDVPPPFVGNHAETPMKTLIAV